MLLAFGAPTGASIAGMEIVLNNFTASTLRRIAKSINAPAKRRAPGAHR